MQNKYVEWQSQNRCEVLSTKLEHNFYNLGVDEVYSFHAGL